MGYTHYWRKAGRPEIEADDWQKIVADAKKLFAACDRSANTRVAFAQGSNKAPLTSPDAIQFNGTPEPHGWETFVLNRVMGEFAFCKTAQRSYDKVVICILASAYEHAPYAIVIESDGDCTDWQEGLAWGSAIIGRELSVPRGIAGQPVRQISYG